MSKYFSDDVMLQVLLSRCLVVQLFEVAFVEYNVTSLWSCLPDKFFVKFICYKFFKNLVIVISKNLSKFLNYIFQDIKKIHFKNFLKNFYNKLK